MKKYNQQEKLKKKKKKTKKQWWKILKGSLEFLYFIAKYSKSSSKDEKIK